MTELDLEQYIEVPDINDEATLPDIVSHISVTNKAIELCEKMMQHIAMGNFSPEFQK